MEGGGPHGEGSSRALPLRSTYTNLSSFNPEATGTSMLPHHSHARNSMTMAQIKEIFMTLSEQELLNEAKSRANRPEFIQYSHVNRAVEGSQRSVVIATSTGEYPEDPRPLSIVAKAWDPKNIYWTLALNKHDTCIVKTNGHKYYRWLGVERGFSKLPIAILSTAKPTKAKSGSNHEEAEVPPREVQSSCQPTYNIPNHRSQRSNNDRDPVTTSLSGNPTYLNSLKVGFRPSHNVRPIGDSPETVPIGDLPGRTRSSKRRKRVESETEEPEGLHRASPRPDRGDSTRAYSPSETTLSMQSASFSRRPPANPHLSHTPLSLRPPPTFLLPQHKINATTLYVRLSPLPGFVPLSLRARTTVSTFYASVLGAWDLEDERLAKVELRFRWRAPEDETMVMRRSPADVFEWFLKAVDEAPCWDEGGKCEVDVTLVVR